jgi:hypothetical protein
MRHLIAVEKAGCWLNDLKNRNCRSWNLRRVMRGRRPTTQLSVCNWRCSGAYYWIWSHQLYHISEGASNTDPVASFSVVSLLSATPTIFPRIVLETHGYDKGVFPRVKQSLGNKLRATLHAGCLSLPAICLDLRFLYIFYVNRDDIPSSSSLSSFQC